MKTLFFVSFATIVSFLLFMVALTGRYASQYRQKHNQIETAKEHEGHVYWLLGSTLIFVILLLVMKGWIESKAHLPVPMAALYMSRILFLLLCIDLLLIFGQKKIGKVSSKRAHQWLGWIGVFLFIGEIGSGAWMYFAMFG